MFIKLINGQSKSCLESTLGKLPLESTLGKLPLESTLGKLPLESTLAKLPLESTLAKLSLPTFNTRPVFSGHLLSKLDVWIAS